MSTCRVHVTCVDDVGPPAYARAFHAMYEAHYDKSAQMLSNSKTVVTSVESALNLLRVASHVGFSTGVDAALLYIQSVPWTMDEETSVAKCINLLQVLVSKGLDARLKTDEEAIRLHREAVRDALVVAWDRRSMKWANALVTLEARKSSINLYEVLVDICNSMFGLFGNAVSLSVGDKLMESLVKGEPFQQVLKHSYTQAKVYEAAYKALLLVLLRIMRALSEGEVVCHDEVKENMVRHCVTVFTQFNSYTQHCFHSSTPLELSKGGKAQHAHFPNSYLKTYKSRKWDITRDLATIMGLVVSTLDYSKRFAIITQLLQDIRSDYKVCYSYSYLDEVVTKLIETSKVSIHQPTLL